MSSDLTVRPTLAYNLRTTLEVVLIGLMYLALSFLVIGISKIAYVLDRNGVVAGWIVLVFAIPCLVYPFVVPYYYGLRRQRELAVWFVQIGSMISLVAVSVVSCALSYPMVTPWYRRQLPGLHDLMIVLAAWFLVATIPTACAMLGQRNRVTARVD